MKRLDLAANVFSKRLLRSRWPQFIVISLALGGFVLAIFAGLAGTVVGSRNFSIAAVWIAWWGLLMLVVVPLFGRGWCSICPIPAPGEWLQRGALLGPRKGTGIGLGRRWPKALRNIWLQNGAFVLLAVFSVVILTQPLVTALLLAALLIAAVVTSLIFERRAFCRYLCPVGGFIGLYSQLAPVELRVKDTAVCASHKEKTCYTGNSDGFGCPWLVFPAALMNNINCGLCFECVRTCPYDNIAFNLRTPGADLLRSRGRRMDEAFKAFIMLGSAIIYIVVLSSPWGVLKSTAYAVGTVGWMIYVLAFLAFIFGVLPGTFLLAVLAARGRVRSRLSLRKEFIAFAHSLIPLGLAAWVAFSISFVFANLSYMWPLLSDPMGWGLNLLGTGGAAWTPYLTGAVPALQVGVLTVGLLWASGLARQIASEGGQTGRRAIRRTAPVVAFCFLVTVGLLALLVG